MNKITLRAIESLDDGFNRARKEYSKARLFMLQQADECVDILESAPFFDHIYIHEDSISLAVNVTGRDQLVELLKWLPEHGFRRRRHDKPYHCQHDAVVLFGFKRGETKVSAHVRFGKSATCKQVEVGTTPVYEVRCEGMDLAQISE